MCELPAPFPADILALPLPERQHLPEIGVTSPNTYNCHAPHGQIVDQKHNFSAFPEPRPIYTMEHYLLRPTCPASSLQDDPLDPPNPLEHKASNLSANSHTQPQGTLTP